MKVIVFDIDGTLANGDHRLHHIMAPPKDWCAYHQALGEDAVHEDIVWMLKQFYQNNNKIILCTGRPDNYREATADWMWKHAIYYHDLYMRKAGDWRHDYDVKIELLDQIRYKHGEPHLWIEDRNKVVAALRQAGVRVLQVKDGEY